MWNSDGRNLNRRDDSLERNHRSFRLTRSLHFRIQRTARRADVQLTPRIPIGSSKDELFLYNLLQIQQVFHWPEKEFLTGETAFHIAKELFL